ncbi:DUF2188 domain-containing protein [Clostridium polynesiense]|uniref:DUF2188 domain-containing protein n=1 Tax=Clostridium polynesiense TaxID=1325933 RepID=UPI0005912B5F|nr:DUF2188 domain-containing protein [Clostridium polynesiense]
MPWNKNDYPSSMKNLPEDQREKAIEIANALLSDGYEDGRAIPIAISTSESWAKNRASVTSSDEAAGRRPGRRSKKETIYHVAFKKDKWIIRKAASKRHSFSFDTKDKALEKAKEILKKTPSRFIIHKKDGSYEKSL